MLFFFRFSPKRELTIFSIPETFVPRFRLIAQNLWEELIIQTFLGATDRRTGVKHNAPDNRHGGIKTASNCQPVIFKAHVP